MTKVIYAIVIIVLLCAIVFICLKVYKKSHDVVAEGMVRAAIKKIDGFYSVNKRYPEDLAEIPDINSIKKKVFGVFKPPKLYYHYTSGSYKITYYIFPFGPFHGYDKKADQWIYEE